MGALRGGPHSWALGGIRQPPQQPGTTHRTFYEATLPSWASSSFPRLPRWLCAISWAIPTMWALATRHTLPDAKLWLLKGVKVQGLQKALGGGCSQYWLYKDFSFSCSLCSEVPAWLWGIKAEFTAFTWLSQFFCPLTRNGLVWLRGNFFADWRKL